MKFNRPQPQLTTRNHVRLGDFIGAIPLAADFSGFATKSRIAPVEKIT